MKSLKLYISLIGHTLKLSVDDVELNIWKDECVTFHISWSWFFPVNCELNSLICIHQSQSWTVKMFVSWCTLICSSMKIIFMKEKSMTVWVQSFMKTISYYSCVISTHKVCLCCRSCRKVDEFFTLAPEGFAYFDKKENKLIVFVHIASLLLLGSDRVGLARLMIFLFFISLLPVPPGLLGSIETLIFMGLFPNQRVLSGGSSVSGGII